jgi:hypothetical protein
MLDETIQDHEAEVVAVETVFTARVAQADDQKFIGHV